MQIHKINKRARAKEIKPEAYAIHGTLIYKHPSEPHPASPNVYTTISEVNDQYPLFQRH